MATKTNIPTKATGDNLTAAEFNELNSNYNTAVDDVNANKTQTEAEAIQLLRLHNPDLVFQGFAKVGDATPAHTANHAWIATESGTIFGLSGVVKGQVIYSTGTAYVAETALYYRDKTTKADLLTLTTDTPEENCFFLFGNTWQGLTSFNAGTYIKDGVLTFFNNTNNRAWFLAGSINNGVSNIIRIKARSSVAGTNILIGSEFASGTSVSRRAVTLTTDYAYYDVEIKAATPDLYITYIKGTQTVNVIEVSEVLINLYDKLETQKIDYLESEVFPALAPKILLSNHNDATFRHPNNWYPAFIPGQPSPTINKQDGYTVINFDAGASQGIRLDNALTVGVDTHIKAIVECDTEGAQIIIGDTISASSYSHMQLFTLNQGLNEIELTLTGVIYTPLYVGIDAARNIGFNLTVHFCSPVEPSGLSQTIDELNNDIDILTGNVSTIKAQVAPELLDEILFENDANATLNTPNDWYGSGSVATLNIVKSDGQIEMNFVSGKNEWMRLDNVLTLSETVKIKTVLNAASATQLKIGTTITSGGEGVSEVLLNLEAGANTFIFNLVCGSTNLFVGLEAARNTGVQITADFIGVVNESQLYSRLNTMQDEIDVLNAEVGASITQKSFFTEDFLVSLSRYDKALTKLIVNGDSLMANEVGGSVSGFEGEGAAPLMLSVNNVPRRIYDRVSWNKPVWRSLFHGDWTKTGWTDDKANILSRAHTLDHYYLGANGASASITIPAGYENFAIICRKASTAGSIAVDLNGSPITVGNATAMLTAANASSFHVEEYLGINSATDNLLEIESTGNNHVWGVLYWSGNTFIVLNVARGGHDLAQLATYFQGDVLNNNPDAVLFQVPEMNELANSPTYQDIYDDIFYFINLLGKTDQCWMSCNPIAQSPVTPFTNYWASYTNPDHRELNDLVRKVIYVAKKPFVDVFNAFEQKVLNQGGTLGDGDAGIYTTDGQHGNEAGQREWWNIIRFVFENKPITYE